MADRDWPDTENLAYETKRRRIYLGLRQVDVSKRGGPSHTTIRDIENQARDSYSLDTYDKLDKALRLKPGSARRSLDGLPFDPLDDAATRRRHIDTKGLSDEQLDQVRALIESMQRRRGRHAS